MSDEPLPKPVEMRRSPGDFAPTSDTINLMTMKVRKGLELPVVALPGVGHMPGPGEDEEDAARLYMWRLRGLHKGYFLGQVGPLNST